ncbi:MAG: glycogen/starch synthase, partial [Acholeplasmataceae bacterium]
MRVMFCSSEVFPFSKTGGLADMAAFLPKAMHKMGHEIKIITPYYPSVAKYHQQMKYLGEANIIMGGIETKVHYFELIHDEISIIFVQNMHYF